MRRLFITYAVLVCHLSNTYAQQKVDETGERASSAIVPEFVDDVRRIPAASLLEPVQLYVCANNSEALRSIFKLDAEMVRREMVRRVSDESYPRRLRNLAAAVVMLRNDAVGRDYFKRQVETLGIHMVDVYYLIGWYGLFGNRETSEHPDMQWAEELMIAALQDKRTLVRDDVYVAKSLSEPILEEVREVAVTVGMFPELLGKMKSKEALPVILSLIHENRYAKDVIRPLGKFGDKRVEPVIMEILQKHDDCYGSAIVAAIDLQMQSALPVLLRHLDDPNTYYGLNKLADASILPVLKRALPDLTSYAKADAQLLILKLQSEDPMPELLTLLRDTNFLGRSDVVHRLKELKDNRAVKDLTHVLCNDVADYMRTFSLRALASIRTADAVEGLIEGLSADYTYVERMKDTRSAEDYRRDFQAEIVNVLKDITKKDFGTNTKQWKKWLAANKN